MKLILRPHRNRTQTKLSNPETPGDSACPVAAARGGAASLGGPPCAARRPGAGTAQRGPTCCSLDSTRRQWLLPRAVLPASGGLRCTARPPRAAAWILHAAYQSHQTLGAKGRLHQTDACTETSAAGARPHVCSGKPRRSPSSVSSIPSLKIVFDSITGAGNSLKYYIQHS